MQPLYNIWLNKFINGSFPLSGSVLYSAVLFSFPLSEVVNGTKIANCTAFGAFPLHGTVRFSTVHFLGVFHWEQFFFFFVPPRFQAIRTVTKTCLAAQDLT